jgi:hypothetical protein
MATEEWEVEELPEGGGVSKGGRRGGGGVGRKAAAQAR